MCMHHRLHAMRREMKVGELKALDSARQRFMNYQQSVKEIHLQRLDDEIRRKVCGSLHTCVRVYILIVSTFIS